MCGVLDLLLICPGKKNAQFMYESALLHFGRWDDCWAFCKKRWLEGLLLCSRIAFLWVNFVVWWLLPSHPNTSKCLTSSVLASRIWSHEWCLDAGKDPTSCPPIDLIVSSNNKRWKWGSIRDAIQSSCEEAATFAWLNFISFDVHILQRRSTVSIPTKSPSGRVNTDHHLFWFQGNQRRNK